MRIDEIREGVQAEYFGASSILEDRAVAREAWERNELVPSRVYPRIGRLIIAPELLNRAVDELKEVGTEVSLSASDLNLGESPMLNGAVAPPFVWQFLRVCDERFAGIVGMDIQTMSPDDQFTYHRSINAGPYSFNEFDMWHRDGDSLDGFTYTSIIFGPGTRFATGLYRSSQFGGGSNDMFLGGEPPAEAISEVQQFDIKVHDPTLTLHAAPAVEHDGELRIFSRIWAQITPQY